MDAHLVFQCAASDSIALADAAVVAGKVLRHDKERYALRARRRVRQARQHDVHDVLGQVVFARRDEDLRAGDAVGAVRGRFGVGLQEAEIGAAVRLGQAHRAGPAAADQRLHEHGLLFLGAVRVDGLHRAVGEAGVHRPRPVGRAVHLADGHADRHRQVLAAIAAGLVERRPAGLDVLLIGLFEPRRRPDFAAIEHLTSGLVADGVQRRHDFFGELTGLLENGVNQLLVDFVTAWQ